MEQGHEIIMSNDKAAEAREGFLDNVTGKAKEVAGAVSGKDDLVEEGQLQQEESGRRKAAVADVAVADAKQQEATDNVRETTREAAQQTGAARSEAAREESSVERQRANEQASAARAAAQEEAAGREAAEERGDEVAASPLREADALATPANHTEAQAATEKSNLEREAARAENEAAKLRAETQK